MSLFGRFLLRIPIFHIWMLAWARKNLAKSSFRIKHKYLKRCSLIPFTRCYRITNCKVYRRTHLQYPRYPKYLIGDPSAKKFVRISKDIIASA